MNSELYLRVREKEGRLYSDEIVQGLPSVPAGHPLTAEWQARAASASRLRRYLARFSKQLTILELGCGNGWLSNVLYRAGHRIVGVDQNDHELRQAVSVFLPAANLGFCKADLSCAPFPFATFEIVVLASVIQYFQDLPGLLLLLFQYLKPQGEIHIIDSPIYLDAEINNARQRSRNYFISLGFPQMADNYFHHCVSDLGIFDSHHLYYPRPWVLGLKRWLGAADSPFPWIRIRKHVNE